MGTVSLLFSIWKSADAALEMRTPPPGAALGRAWGVMRGMCNLQMLIELRCCAAAPLVTQTLQGGGDAAAAGDEFGCALAVHRHDRRAT